LHWDEVRKEKKGRKGSKLSGLVEVTSEEKRKRTRW